MHASPDPDPTPESLETPDADRLTFSEDVAPPPAPDPDERFWRVMVVDDDEDVHEATRFALLGLRVNGRRLQLLHARSALQARRLLASEADIAVILLDVVMETDDAGLRLVRHIREDLGLRRVRIVLRTGQPGQAPESVTSARTSGCAACASCCAPGSRARRPKSPPSPPSTSTTTRSRPSSRACGCRPC